VREFASTSARVATLPPAAKVLYTAFCAAAGFSALHLVVPLYEMWAPPARSAAPVREAASQSR